jgi:Protein of unknown function (DUF1236)
MHLSASALLVVCFLLPDTGLSQTLTSLDEVEATGSLPVALGVDKLREIKRSFERSDRALWPHHLLPRVAEELDSGMLVPPWVALIILPQDAITEIPTTTSYRFVLMSEGRIAVIHPITRRVVQVIK